MGAARLLYEYYYFYFYYYYRYYDYYYHHYIYTDICMYIYICMLYNVYLCRCIIIIITSSSSSSSCSSSSSSEAGRRSARREPPPCYATLCCTTVSFHNFKPQNFKLSVSNPESKYIDYLSVLSQISNCQSLGRKNKHEILKTDRMIYYTILYQTIM